MVFQLKACLAKKKLDFQVLLDVSSPKRRCKSSRGRLVPRLSKGVRLGVGMYG